MSDTSATETMAVPESAATGFSRILTVVKHDRLRKFAREVGTIVLGVLIALAIGEVADEIRWNVRAARTDKVIREEQARNAAVVEERLIATRCIERRVAALKTILAEARRSGNIPDIGTIGRPAARPMLSTAWAGAQNNGITMRMDPGTVTMIGGYYAVVDQWQTMNDEEQHDWSTLALLEHAPGPLDGNLLASAVEAINTLQYRTRMNQTYLRQMYRHTRLRGIATNYFVTGAADRAVLARQVTHRPLCRPLMVDGRPFRH